MKALSLIIPIVLAGCINSCVIPNGRPYTSEEKTIDTTFADENDSEHITFKGIALNGTLKQFVDKLQRKGFYDARSYKSEVRLKGDFAGFNDCIVHVATLDNNDIVAKIAVEFPHREQWQLIESDYKTLKELLTEKYGKPEKVQEKFDKSYINDDQFKYQAIQFDQCKYQAIFKAKCGTITLSITHNSLKCFVQLEYLDKLNGESVRKTAIDDL